MWKLCHGAVLRVPLLRVRRVHMDTLRSAAMLPPKSVQNVQARHLRLTAMPSLNLALVAGPIRPAACAVAYDDRSGCLRSCGPQRF